MAAQVDFEYDELLGNDPHPACLLSFTREQNFVIATERALPWSDPADGDDARRTVPIAWIESLLRTATVRDPESLRMVPFLSRCLHRDFLRQGLEVLMQHGLVASEDDDDEAVRDFGSFNELQEAADKIVANLEPDELPDIDEDSWDTFEAVDAASPVGWLEGVTMEALTRRARNLRAYVDLCKLLGPRALEQHRADPMGQLNVMAGGALGGQLLAVVKSYYLDPSQVMAPIPPTFMAHRLADFFEDSRWPYPYETEHVNFMDYAFDMAQRARWQKASEDEWPSLIQGKIVHAVGRLYPMSHLLADVSDQPGQLTMYIQRLGAGLLGGAQSNKKVFWRINELNGELDTCFRGLIEEGRAANVTTQELTNKIMAIAANTVTKGKDTNMEGETQGEANKEEAIAPRQDQLKKALAEQSFSRLEQKFLEKLKDPSDETDKLDIISECFSEPTVLPKAVLLCCPGVKMSNYTQISEFLEHLRDHRDKLPLYFGQCMATDPDTQEVPSDLSTFEWERSEVKLFCGFQWEKLDPLNQAVLRLRAEEVGTHYATHDVREAYHHGDTIQHIKEVYGKLFESIGYPETVPSSAGLSFRGFMSKIKRMHEVTMGMTPKEAPRMFDLIDGYVLEGYRAAAANAKRTIYGASPADKKLGAWIPKDEPLLSKIDETWKNLQMVRSFRKAMPGVFESVPTARMLPGFEKKREREGDDADQGGGKKHAGRGSGGSDDAGKNDSRRGEGTRKGDGKQKGRPSQGEEPVDANSRQARANKDLRLKLNPKRIFHYDDGTYSLKKQWYDWPGICKKFGWQPDKLCGPVIMALTREHNREHNCMHPGHKCAPQTRTPRGHDPHHGEGIPSESKGR